MALSDKQYELSDFEQVLIEKYEQKKEKEKEIASNMLKIGLDIKIISKSTDLTIEEVEELKKNLN